MNPTGLYALEAIRQTATKLTGVYRLRGDGDGPARLAYIRQTDRSLRERLLSLVADANAEDCPFNDSHTGAPHLWLLRHHDEARFAFCCAPCRATCKPCVARRACCCGGTGLRLAVQPKPISAASTRALPARKTSGSSEKELTLRAECSIEEPNCLPPGRWPRISV
jgi:hypothetical protein